MSPRVVALVILTIIFGYKGFVERPPEHSGAFKVTAIALFLIIGAIAYKDGSDKASDDKT